ncbi:MAG: recombinase family protein, partial [Candidatus Limnocylindria bacterium]
MTRALIYARLSQDRNGQSTSTARQVAACEAWAAARGWEVAGKYVDADLSAFKGVARPQYDAMLEAVTEGDGDLVLAWKLDRILRRPRDFERLWAMCEDRGANLATV